MFANATRACTPTLLAIPALIVSWSSTPAKQRKQAALIVVLASTPAKHHKQAVFVVVLASGPTKLHKQQVMYASTVRRANFPMQAHLPLATVRSAQLVDTFLPVLALIVLRASTALSKTLLLASRVRVPLEQS